MREGTGGFASGRSGCPTRIATLSPYLVVEGAERVIAFMKEVFDASELRRYDMPDGSIMHADMLVDDVDAVSQRALAAGAESVE